MVNKVTIGKNKELAEVDKKQENDSGKKNLLLKK